MGPGRGLQRNSLFLLPPDTVTMGSKARVSGSGGPGAGGCSSQMSVPTSLPGSGMRKA